MKEHERVVIGTTYDCWRCWKDKKDFHLMQHPARFRDAKSVHKMVQYAKKCGTWDGDECDAKYDGTYNCFMDEDGEPLNRCKERCTTFAKDVRLRFLHRQHAFTNLPMFNLTQQTPVDMLHTGPLGVGGHLYKALMWKMRNLLSATYKKRTRDGKTQKVPIINYEQEVLNVMCERMSKFQLDTTGIKFTAWSKDIPKKMDSLINGSGTHRPNLGGITAREMEHALLVLPCILSGLVQKPLQAINKFRRDHGSEDSEGQPDAELQDPTSDWLMVLKQYNNLMCGYRQPDRSLIDLKELVQDTQSFVACACRVFPEKAGQTGEYPWAIPKIHSMEHIPENILEWGWTQNFCVEHFEHDLIYFIKLLVRLTNRRPGWEGQILRRLDKEVISEQMMRFLKEDCVAETYGNFKWDDEEDEESCGSAFNAKHHRGSYFHMTSFPNLRVAVKCGQLQYKLGAGGKHGRGHMTINLSSLCDSENRLVKCQPELKNLRTHFATYIKWWHDNELEVDVTSSDEEVLSSHVGTWNHHSMTGQIRTFHHLKIVHPFIQGTGVLTIRAYPFNFQDVDRCMWFGKSNPQDTVLMLDNDVIRSQVLLPSGAKDLLLSEDVKFGRVLCFFRSKLKHANDDSVVEYDMAYVKNLYRYGSRKQVGNAVDTDGTLEPILVYEPSLTQCEVIPAERIIGRLPILPHYHNETIPKKDKSKKKEWFPHGEAGQSRLWEVSDVVLGWGRPRDLRNAFG